MRDQDEVSGTGDCRDLDIPLADQLTEGLQMTVNLGIVFSR